ncbi:hypothetical protein CF319_g6504 [Tilletia indica]|nr:hypothetical protein CF319_g6504 [Tilletia indica]
MTAPYFLTLAPIDSSLPAQTVASSTPPTSTSPSSLEADDKSRDVPEPTVTGMTSSVDIAMIRIRTAWIRARATVMDGSRGVQHAQLALTRVLEAWRTERAAVMASSESTAPPSITYLPAACSWISSLPGWPGTSL